MNTNREQTLFIASLVVIGFLGYLRLSDAYEKPRVSRPKSLAVAETVEPPKVLLPSAEPVGFDLGGRDFFQPPKDWNPLALLVLNPPPPLEISSVGPLTDPGVGPSHFKLYRKPPESGLVIVATPSGDDLGGAGTDDGTDTRSSGLNLPPRRTIDATKTPDEGTLKRVYDWIQPKTGGRRWGYILNDNKLGLIDNQEPLRFQSVNIAGKGGGITATFERTTLASAGAFGTGYGFADSVPNRLALMKRKFDARSNVASLLAAARECLGWTEEDEATAIRGADYFVELAAAQDRTNPDIWLLKGVVRQRGFDTDGELAVYAAARESGIDDPLLRVREAAILQRLGLYGKAEELLQQATRQDLNCFEAFMQLGRLYAETGRSEESVRMFATAEDLSRNRTPEERLESRIELAEAELLYGAIEEASRVATKGVNQAIDSADLKVLQGVTELIKGNAPRAMGEFRSALEIDAANWAAIYNLGVAAISAGDVVVAQESLADAVDVDPLRGFDSAVARGILDELAGNFSSAANSYDEALALHPAHPFGLYRAGRAARRIGDLDQAHELLREALAKDGRITDVLNELGFVEILRDEPRRAELYLRESLRREPNSPEVLLLLGSSLIRQSRVREARDVFEDAVSNGNDRTMPAAFCGVAWCAYRQGEIDEAVGRFAEARAAAVTANNIALQNYAEQNQVAIDDHHRKEEWQDIFDREQIKNNWNLVDSYGVAIELDNGAIKMRGTQRRTDGGAKTEFRREIEEMASFVLFGADISIAPTSDAVVGVHWVYERTQNKTTSPYQELGVGMDKVGRVLVFERNGFDDDKIVLNWIDTGTIVDPTLSHRFTIERVDYANGRFELRVDGKVVQEISETAFRNFKKASSVGVFAFADGLKSVDATCDFVRIVRYAEGK